jgi:signal transduction histidine kinase
VANGTRAGIDKRAAGALLGSMQAVQQALARPAGLPAEQLVDRLREWQCLVKELAGGVAQEAELATLYDITQVLNSSLDLAETLNVVMDSLIHLTEAERGCLMLLDEEGNLEICAAQNFGQGNGACSDLELSHTVVRRVVEEGQPMLATNAQLDPRLSSYESVVGYQLRSIVCVPLHLRGGVIGALYLDNRVREGVFSEEKLPLLMAFANQAAVAIENARLYTMTDQALAARVEELTTLQQIDQELNASLDFERVLELTLSWAMRATRAEEGMLCILDDKGAISAVITAGDDGAPADPEPDLVRLVMRSHEPIVVGGLRVVVPIRLEDRVVGLLDLRSNGSLLFRPEHAQLAGRLADHAAVAIQNARLYEQVRQADRAKSEFVSFVSHELRTPMTSIRGYADMLGKEMVGPLTPQQEDFVHTIRNNVERMQVLVSDLQDVSRIETGQLRLETKPTTLVGAVAGALQATQAQMEARSQQLVVEVPADLPPVRADPARLTQILINLLSNATKYTPEGGSVSVRAWLNGKYAHCSVSDTGIGISSEDRARLFTKFFRSEDPAVREVPGTGLGLCIVKSLVELQGGEIGVESQPGEGSTFTFTLPVAAEE